MAICFIQTPGYNADKPACMALMHVKASQIVSLCDPYSMFPHSAARHTALGITKDKMYLVVAVINVLYALSADFRF